MADASPVDVFEVMKPLREPLIQAAIEWLGFPRGSRGLDDGCGIGLEGISLMQAVAPSGKVIGVDFSLPSLFVAKGKSGQHPQAGNIDFTAGDWSVLPFADACLDWAWSCDGVGYAPYYQDRAVKEIARVVRPGGVVAILFWSSQALLPGYPGLEARLNATRAGMAPFGEEMPPEAHANRGLSWLRAVGLERLRAKTFIHSVYAPIDANIRAALIALLEMRWGGCESELAESDRAAYQRICRLDSADFILDCPDYYAFFAYTVFCGWKTLSREIELITD